MHPSIYSGCLVKIKFSQPFGLKWEKQEILLIDFDEKMANSISMPNGEVVAGWMIGDQ